MALSWGIMFNIGLYTEKHEKPYGLEPWYLAQELVTNFFHEKVGVCICNYL